MTIKRFSNLTQYERLGIDQIFNLADGHARQFQNASQQGIVDRLDAIYLDSQRMGQQVQEATFQRAFYQVAGQPSAIHHPGTLLCYSASLATDLVATFVSSEGLSVSLLQPCFDNLATILRRRGVVLTPVSEAALGAENLGETIRAMTSDAIFLTLPNNPTGFGLEPYLFESLARCCAALGKILIVDWTFRFFGSWDAWDQYDVLKRSGVSYLCIEDTGKTWPTLDLKCSILACSDDLYRKILHLHNDLLLNVSPFILGLLTCYLEDTMRQGLESTVRRIVQTNRVALRQALHGTALSPCAPGSTVSVEWVRIDSDHIDSEDVVDLLATGGIGILPGEPFYWHDEAVGRRYVRFALARDPSMFSAACRRLETIARRSPGLTGRKGDRR